MNNVEEEDELKCLYKSKYLEHVERKKETLTYNKIQTTTKMNIKIELSIKECTRLFHLNAL